MTLTDDQVERILDDLSEGFGVEDIAVDTGWPVEAIRGFVFSLLPDLRRQLFDHE